MQVQRATSREVPRIVEILREGFPRELLPMSIQGCAGYESYVDDSLQHQDHAASGWYVLRADAAEVAGFLEFRRDPQYLFVNHIFLDAAVRGRGLGTRLLRQTLQETRDAGQSYVALDVFHDNEGARRWYRHQGFREGQECWWLETPLTAATRANGPWYSQGLAQAGVLHQRYQFSEFTLLTAQKTYRIGRLGGHLFRTTDPAVLDDSSAMQALAALDPKRRLLAIGPAEVLGPRMPAGATICARSLRLTAEIDAVL